MLTRVLLKSFIRPLLNLWFSCSECCEWRGHSEVVHRSPSGQRKRLLPGADEEVCGVAEECRRGWVAIPVKPDGFYSFKDKSPSGFLYCSYLMWVSPVFQSLSLRRKRTETEAGSLRSGIIYCQKYCLVFRSWRVQIIQGLNLQNCFLKSWFVLYYSVFIYDLFKMLVGYVLAVWLFFLNLHFDLILEK